ncbi:histidine phosphatase family protein [Moraxella marmotae]|uniref:histidine phosphatase family protein n=1 Tax=Moraxella marmotae TaxID=3344520 RepID=UPI0035F280A9
MILSCLRHGETELLTQGMILRGKTDDALTDKGWQQMLDGFNQGMQINAWQAIITSPLSRCADFAHAQADKYQLPMVVIDGLQEMDFGDWEGQFTADLYAKYPKQLAAWWQKPTQFTPNRGESIMQFARRIDDALVQIDRLCQTHAWDNLCVITHGGVIKYLYLLALNLPLDEILSQPVELGEIHRFIYQQGKLSQP